MKRFTFVVIASLSSLILGACQEKLEWEIKMEVIAGNAEPAEEYGDTIEYEDIMPVKGGSAQGGDCWGDYFFQFSTNNSYVSVYDLATKAWVQTISIPSSQRGFVSNCHCNTVCFGTEYYDAEDLFPLIYVSTGYASDGYTGALAYRILQHNGVFSLSLVQTIKFPVDKSSWTEFVPGDKFAYLCYTAEKVVFRIEMPKLKDGDIVIGRDSAIETYQFSPQPEWMATSRNQDRLYHQGKILYITGVPPGEASAFVILNLETLKRERIVDFKKIGLESESESIFNWRGDICVAFKDRIVKLTL